MTIIIYEMHHPWGTGQDGEWT